MHLDEPVVIACTQDGRVECFGRKERQNSAQDHAICKIGRRLHVLARGKALNLIDVKEEIAPLYAIPSAAGQSHPCAACSEKNVVVRRGVFKALHAQSLLRLLCAMMQKARDAVLTSSCSLRAANTTVMISTRM